MRIGEKVGTHTSPQREVRKAGERVERPIPVHIPEKIPAKAEWNVEWRFMYGIDRAIMKDYIVFGSAVS